MDRSEQQAHERAARRLWQLADSGSDDLEDIRELPEAWRLAYQRVAVEAQAGAGRGERMAAFQAALGEMADSKGAERMYWDFIHAAPPLPSAEPERLRRYSAAEALQPPPEPAWCVDGLITRPSLNLLVGAPGSKKTWLALDLSVCAALGQPWLGRATQAAPVLFIDEESGVPRLWQRLHAVMQARQAPAETPLEFIALAGFDLRKPAEAQRLQAQAESVGARLLVIDALVDVMRGGDENSVQDVQPVFHHLRQIAAACEAAVVVLHHTNKQGGYRGSSSMLGAVDLMLQVESAPGESLVHFKTLKARDIEPAAFSARAQIGDGLFRLSATEEKAPARLSAAARGVLAYLRTVGEAEARVIVENVEGAGKEAARQQIYALREQGLIVQSQENRCGLPSKYTITSEGVKILGE